MARPIDEKIVKMSMDNKDFKTKVAETLQSFDSIEKGINASGSNMDLSNISEGISAIERRFSATGVVIASIINSLTTSALSLGRNLTQSIIGPLVEGGKTRALNIEQAQFQFKGLGMDVKATMDSALAAVKGTAFGLDEAAVVASQFGATGMRAGEQMTDALRGISGVAAMTGSSYSDIGSIFTTVAGNGRLMGSELLRLSSRGVNAAATLAKSMNLTEAEVRSMVSKGQIDFETFAGAMNDAFGEHATKANETYVGSLSNVKAALGRIGAAIYAPGFENKRNMFNALTPVIDEIAEAISPLIGAWTELNAIKTDAIIKFINGIDVSGFVKLGGVSNMVQSFWNVMNSGITILKSVTEGFKRVLPPSLTNGFVGITESILRFTEGLKVSGSTADKLTTVFHGVFSVFSTVFIIAKELAGALLNLIPVSLGGSLLDILVKIAEFAIGMNESVKEGNLLTDAIGGLGKVLGSIGKVLGDIIRGFADFAMGLKSNIGGALNWLQAKLAPVGRWISTAFSGFGMDELLGGGVLVGIFMIVKKITGMFDNFSGIFGAVKDSFGGIGTLFSQVGDSLEAFQSQIKYSNLMKIAVAIGILALSMKLLEGMKTEDIVRSLTALGTSLGVMMTGMAIIDKYKITGGIRSSITIIALATAVLIMATALKKISDLDLKSMMTGVAGLVAVTGALAGAVIAMSKWGGKIGTSALSLLALSTAVYILAGAIKKMSDIDAGSLFKAVGALAIIFLELAIFLKVVDKSKLSVGSAVGLLVVAAAIQVIVSAITKIADIDMKGIGKGFLVIGGVLALVAGFSIIAKGPMLIMAGAGLLIIAAAINALVKPIETLGNMSLAELGKGLGAMAVALLLISGAAMLMQGAALGAVGLVVMAMGLNMLYIPIKAFSKMTWGELIKGFVGVAGGLILVAGASLLLAPAVIPMLGFGAALMLMGLAMTAAGLGIGLFATGLVTLAGLTATSIVAIVSAISMLLIGLGHLIGDVIEFIVVLGLAIINGLATLIPAIVEVVFLMVDSILETLVAHTPSIIRNGVLFVLHLIDGIDAATPLLVEAAVNLIITFITTLSTVVRDQGPVLLNAIMGLLAEVIILFIQAGVMVIDALFGWIPGVSSVTANIGASAEASIRESFGAAEVGDEKGSDFASALDGTSGDAFKAGELIANSGKDGATSIELGEVGANFGQGFIGGIASKFADVYEAGKKLAKKASNAVKDWLQTASPSKLTTGYGVNTGEGLVVGMGRMLKPVAKSGLDLAKAATNSMLGFLDEFQIPEEDAELEFRAVINYDSFDPKGFGKIGNLNTNMPGLNVPTIAALRGQVGSEEDGVLDDILRAIKEGSVTDEVINLLEDIVEGVKSGATVLMDGKVVSTVLEPHIQNIQDRNTIKKNRARGVIA